MASEESEQAFYLRIMGKAKPFHEHARWMRWNLARFLIALILLVFPCLGVTVTNHMVTKSVDASGGCPVPTSTTPFLTTHQRVWGGVNITWGQARLGEH